VFGNPPGDEPDDQADARLDGRRGQRPAGRGGRARQPGGGQDVGGERGQVCVGPRGQRPACARVELVPGQPAIRERVLQRLDQPLAVAVTRPEPVTARPYWRGGATAEVNENDVAAVSRAPTS
jgi:hypothetical protein